MTANAVALDKPAIAGGSRIKSTPYGAANRYGDEELTQLREALDQGTLFYAQGRKVKEMEAAAAKMIGCRFAIATSSGTTAIHAALIAAGISPGEEVIVPPITDMGSIIPILWQGAIPVFADLDPRTYNLDPASVERAITPTTRAIVAVHLAGSSCDLATLSSIARARNLVLIEDCAQAWGTTFNGKWVGTHGIMGCFSFNEFKHISCGDGGIVVTNDEKLAERIRLATDKGYRRGVNTPAERNPTFLANNYRMSELQGAVALAQLGKLESIVARRRVWTNELHAAVQMIPGLLAPRIESECNPSWWFYLMRVTPELGADADTFAQALQAEGLNASAHYIGQCVYEGPLFRDHSAFARTAHPFSARSYTRGLCATAEEILRTAVFLPINENYTQEDLAQTIHAIRRAAAWYAGRDSSARRY